MPPFVVILGLPGSDFARCLGEAIEERGCRPALLSLDAPLEGRPVTLCPGELLWEGVDLRRAGAVLVEAPLYCWPQPQRLEGIPGEPAARTKHLTAEREARSLALSALCVAAGEVPVVNPPEAAYLAAAPGAALSRLDAGGLPVHEWRLGPAPDPNAARGGVGRSGTPAGTADPDLETAGGLAPAGAAGSPIVLDAAGRDRFHRPARPPAGEPALLLAPFEGTVLSLIVVGDRAVAGRLYASAAAWCSRAATGAVHLDLNAAVADRSAGDRAEPREEGEVRALTARSDAHLFESISEPHIPAAASALALRAAGLLSLPVAAVAIKDAATGPVLLHADAGPDLAVWDAASGGALAGALADLLVSGATHPLAAPRSDVTLSLAPGPGGLR